MWPVAVIMNELLYSASYSVQTNSIMLLDRPRLIVFSFLPVVLGM
jgi:hypothetical protein